MKSLKNPKRSVRIKTVTLRQFPTPGIVDNYGSAHLGSLNNGFNLAAILRTQSDSFGEQEVHGPLVITIATLKECVGIK